MSRGMMWPEPGNGAAELGDCLLHSIGETSRLTGVSRGMLRLWERERLINPKRTPGGHRLYSSNDLQRLRQIAHLRRVDRLNMAAIRRELGATGGASTPSGSHSPGELGQRLRALRNERQWSLMQVAEKSGLSVSFLSAVERGQSSISVASLFKLADAYGTTVPGLSLDYQAQPRSLLHPRERPRYVAGRGLVLIEDLIASPGALEAQRIEIQPNGGSEEGYAHPGEEFVYVLAGQLAFWIDESEHYRLQVGDSLYFRSTRLHRWWNDGDTATTVLWINVPVVELALTAVAERNVARARRSESGVEQRSKSL